MNIYISFDTLELEALITVLTDYIVKHEDDAYFDKPVAYSKELRSKITQKHEALKGLTSKK